MSQYRRSLYVSALIGLALLLTPWAALAGPSKATVTSVRGTVTVHHAMGDAAPSPARSGTTLQPGDRLDAGPKSRATILLPWGAIKILRSGDSFRIPGEEPGAPGPGLLDLSQNVASVFLASREKTSDMEKLDIRAGTRSAEGGLARVILLSPRNTAVLSQRPTFLWSAQPEATSYTIKITALQGKVVERETSTASYPYGSDAPPLKPGVVYFWEVIAKTPTGRVPSGKAHFSVLGTDERELVRTLSKRIRATPFADPEDSTPHYLLAHVYIDKGLYEMAARSLLRAARMNPNDQGLVDLLQGVYREMELETRGIALFQEIL